MGRWSSPRKTTVLHRGREDGQDLVEFALIAPIVFLFLFGILEFGLVIWHYNTLSIAAREGARAAVTLPKELPDTERLAIARDTAENYAQSVMVSGVVAQSSFGEYLITDEDTGLAKSLPTVQVHVGFDHLSATGLFGPLHMEASSTMLVE